MDVLQHTHYSSLPMVETKERYYSKTANLLPSGNEWKEQFEEVYKHHYADIETKGKLEFVIPLIPGFLSYKGEIGGGFKTKIKDIWEDIKRPFVKDDKD